MDLFELQGSSSNGRRRITAERFKNVTLRKAATIYRAILVFRLEQKFAIGDCQHLHDSVQGGRSQESLLN
ncbi:hypothetical protein D9M73_212860 [compost metagenome]